MAGHGNPLWRKGVSGNPSGRPRVVFEVRELARAHTAEAIASLVEICRSGRNESARVAAAIALLDRGYGRPVQQFHTTPNDPSLLTDSELTAIIRSGVGDGVAEEGDPPVIN